MSTSLPVRGRIGLPRLLEAEAAAPTGGGGVRAERSLREGGALREGRNPAVAQGDLSPTSGVKGVREGSRAYCNSALGPSLRGARGESGGGSWRCGSAHQGITIRSGGGGSTPRRSRPPKRPPPP